MWNLFYIFVSRIRNFGKIQLFIKVQIFWSSDFQRATLGKSMAVVAGSSDESEEDTRSTGDSAEWGIVAAPNLNSGSLIGQRTVHQSK